MIAQPANMSKSANIACASTRAGSRFRQPMPRRMATPTLCVHRTTVRVLASSCNDADALVDMEPAADVDEERATCSRRGVVVPSVVGAMALTAASAAFPVGMKARADTDDELDLTITDKVYLVGAVQGRPPNLKATGFKL